MVGLLSALPGGEIRDASKSVSLPPPDMSVVVKDSSEKEGKTAQENSPQIPSIIAYISDRWQRSCNARRPYEQLWLDAHRNYRGLYGSDVQFTASERSRVFIRVTKTKINAAYGQIMDVLFANNTFPIAIEPEKLPEGVKDIQSVETDPAAQVALQQKAGPKSKVGYRGDGTREGELSSLAASAFIGELSQSETQYDGPALDATSVEYDIPLLSAKKMEKKIQDQLKACNADKQLRHAAFECVALGTGCIKGPIAITDAVVAEDEQGNSSINEVKRPAIEAVSIWSLYPDPDSKSPEECDYLIQRHKLTKSQLRGLKKRTGFRANEIEECIAGGYKYVPQWWEAHIKDMPVFQNLEKFEVFEYWGMLDRELAEEWGIDFSSIPEEMRSADELPVNVWICGNHLLRLIINPFNNGRHPYYLIPYEVQPYVIWGIGVAESMADTQMLMNGFMRLAVDNAVLSGNVILEMDETTLVPGQSYDLYPGKVFRKQSGQAGQSIYPIEFPNTSAACMQLYDKARELADQATFPSFTHGQTDVNPSLGRTSSGLSMMMGAASVGIRTAIKNWDDYLLTPLGQALFEFNKLNSDDPELKGNFTVEAGGTQTLMRTEVRSQRLLSLIQLLQSPALAPFVKWGYVLRDVMESLDIDPNKSTNTMPEAIRFAELLKQMMPQQGQQQQQAMPSEGSETGQVSMPTDNSFSANKTDTTGMKHASPGQGIS